ncbi:TOMM precursor leader peptide-binding protein [Kamptonema animale CS-326]|jgi:bacteriocin biosynthesis cyclodehydratase domain-containing protein|uniref:TOMM precursor leader peptide-binding protein n=1 Tax=Kamptonema animale TaxID=92934 RepID=UPI00233142E4|nr:TOMM precursor leader peptide-binding protein [Kamptonema animale]MDB9509932.1 TOMM precursor leader peptide-binding protein [Kamptonema animale CS-326]
MLKRPRFKTQFRVETLEGEGTFLLSENGSIFLSDPIYQSICPLLEGNHTVDEIVDLLQEELPDAYIYYALMELERQGFLIESETILPANLTVFIEHLNVNIKDAYHRLQETKVRVKALGYLSASSFIEILNSLHIQIAEDANFEVVLTDDYLRPKLAEINQENQIRSRPWMLVKPIGTSFWIGPIFHTPQTGCWECLSQRLEGNRPLEKFIQRRRNNFFPLTPPLADLPSTQQTALTMAATELLKWIIQGENKCLEGVLITHDTLTSETRKHPLIKRPQCNCCGILKAEDRQPLPVVIGSRKKEFITDGGHRCVSPEETFERYKHHISPIVGVVRELGKLSRNSNGLTPTYFAKHHFASMFDEFSFLQQNLGGRSAGKGRTEAQAKSSAFCEAIERYSGVFQGDEYRIKSSYQQLGNRAIHPNHCMNFSQNQYENRTDWNAKCGSFFQRVPEPFDETREIDWTPVWSLTHQEFKYLPTAYCYFGYPQPPQPDCWADTNGCAAGNTLEEAILQGFMELVERDSVALWWYNRISRPRVDLESFDERYFQDLVNYYRSINREIWVLDITSDLNIPAFAAISRRCDSLRDSYASREVEDIILGFGAHFDPKLAVQRALTEVNQLLPPVLTANADGTTQYASSADPPVINWWKTATLQNQPYLVPASQIASKVYSDYPRVDNEDLLDDIKLCQQIVEQKGMEMLVLDQTRPDIGLRVVKVIVPGMRHFWKRVAPGRLYQVPVQLGWLEEPMTEEMLNQIPVWL